jgi:hypothetical protein
MEPKKLQWSSAGHTVREKNTDWYWILWIVSASLAVSALIFKDVLTAALIAIAGATITLLAKAEATNEDYSIDEKGITVDGYLYTYEKLQSFEIAERKDMPTLLVVNTSSPLNPHLFIHLTDDVPLAELRAFLDDTLPETTNGVPLSHQIVEFLGL